MAGRNFGRYLSEPSPGEEVVITGVSGRFPKSKSVKELGDNLFAKRVLTSDVKERWNIEHTHLPPKIAKIDDLDRLDAGHFGIHYRQANVMDPLLRIFLEVTFEAVLDAGLHPSELEGTRTGVFVGSCFSDIEVQNLMKLTDPQSFGLTGLMRTFVANRISYYLKLKGPSVTIDTACSSSANALETAFKAIRSGKCDNAIVGGAHLCLNPYVTIQFERLGVLSLDGVCRVFDQDANGYIRGDSISCVLLQKARNARRVYGQVIHSNVNDNGFQIEGIGFPSSESQQQLLTEILEESGINPSDLSYLEVHGTGTRAGDPEEIKAIDEAIARRRDKPLWIGSVKCNLGHSEAASGLVSLSKVLIAFEEGRVPPIINLTKVRDSLHAILEGRLKIVTETKELENQEAIVGINNFGFGGNNCHMLVRRFKKMKINGGLPEDNVPRLVCVSGRTRGAVLTLLNELKAKPLDCEHVALLHHVFKEDIKNHLFRGFTIISKKETLKLSLKFYRQKTQFYVYFGRFDYLYKTLGQLLLEFPVFKDTILRINNQLLSKSVNVVDVIFKKQIVVEQDIIGAIAVQIGFVDLLRSLNIYPTAVYGEHLGKLAAKYYYGALKLEEIIQIAYGYFESAEKKDKTEINSCFNTEVYSLNPDNIINRNEDGANIHGDSINFKTFNRSKNATVLNISDRRLLAKDILLADCHVLEFLEILGSLYEQGHNPHLHKLYPEINFPVSRGTAMIAPSIKWHHEESWYTDKIDTIVKPEGERVNFEINIFADDFRDLTGHIIDGRNLIPASEYLRLVWKAFSQWQRLNLNNTPVVFENCRFLRAVTLPTDGTIHLMVVIHQDSGHFEVLQGNLVIVNGRIFSPNDINSHKSTLAPFDFDDSDSTQVLMQDEIYRELYLRGYNYSGLFKGIIKCNIEASVGMIQWENNWTTFIDKMLQIKILQLDTRQLYVPVGLDRLIIDPFEHLQCTQEENEAVVAVHAYKDCGTIKAGGIEIHGLQAKSIAKRKPRLEPVLEKHMFVPNEGQLDLATSIRANIQIILENSLENDFNAVELTENLSQSETKYLLPLVSQVLEDLPSIKPNLILSTETDTEDMPGITKKKFNLTATSNLSLIVGNRLLEKSNVAGILNALNKNGFVLTRENVNIVPINLKNIEIITEYTIANEKIILFRKSVETIKRKYVQISSDHFKWLAELQQTVKIEPNIVLYSQNQEFSGLMGFINCIRREPGLSKVTCFLIMDEAPKFDPQHPFYQNQLKKNLAVNVYKNSKWGTYRHLLLGEMEELESEHVRVNTIRSGDLSSLKWIKGPLTQSTSLTTEGYILIQNCYSALNFKDVMIASGRLSKEAFSTNRLEQECWLGLEFAGVDKSGRRVAGMTTQSGLSSLLAAPLHTLWQVPDSWTLEDAATVTVVYLTVIYSLLKITVVKPGISILIHSATGGVGLAALNVCLYHGCKIFVTVGTKEKRDYLRKHYPQIPVSHIGNSRDTSFEEMIKTETKGHGVDIVLNSLTEEKLIASIRCLATGGNFVEIGKYDLANNNALNLMLFEKQINYHGIGVDAVRSPEVNKWMINTLEEGIRLGFVKPLPRKVFKQDEIETAFRYMTTGKHIGKVLIKIRENNEKDKTPITRFKGLPRFYCNPEKCYIIVGGLGGIGLELADWLILKGARKLVLVTSTGVKSGYQSQRLRLWASYKTEIHVSKANVTTKEGCIQLIKEANRLGSVDAIFNLAVVLQDALFEDQTEEKFHISFAPKVYSTKWLDEASRGLCPDLNYFVVFSSVSCGRGNAGQTNYGMANSIMERICEKRKKEGFPALAIQWGAIGDVGLVAQMQKENKELVIGGTLQQKISSCLEVLDKLLTQDNPIVSSMVVAEKTRRNFDAESPAEAVAAILGIKEMKTISPHTTLAELGMDSMTGTEVVQVLEKDFEIYVTPKDVRSLTFAKLTEMKNNRTCKETQSDKALKDTSLLLQYLPENRNNEHKFIKLPSLVNEDTEADIVFVFSGIEGVFKPLEQITKKIKAHFLGVSYNYDNPEDTIEQSAKAILPHLKKKLMRQKSFRILGYSYGVLIALEVAHLLEKDGYIGSIVAVDGSPAYSVAAIKQIFPVDTEAEFQTSLIFKIISIALPTEILEQNKEKFLKCNTLDDRLDLALAMIPPHPSKDELDKQGAIAVYKRFKAVLNYNFLHDKIKSNLNLIKAKYPMMAEIDNDYKLSELCEQPVHVNEVDGDHATILSNIHLVDVVNKLLA